MEGRLSRYAARALGYPVSAIRAIGDILDLVQRSLSLVNTCVLDYRWELTLCAGQ